MRCRKAKQKLNDYNYKNSEIANDEQLVNHLQECTSCKSLVSAESSLRADFQAASVDDNEEVVSNWLLKAQVERRAAMNHSKFKENQLMALFKNFLQRQSKLTIGVSTVAAVLLLSVLITFSYNETIGYEVAFAGVNKDLALDSNKLHVLLDKLGLKDAKFDVSGCEATCNVKISDLKSQDDAKLLVAAFNEMEHVVLEDVKAVYETKEGNIYKRLSFTAQDGTVADFEFYDKADTDEMHNLMLEKFGDDLHEMTNVFVVKSDSTEDIAFGTPDSHSEFFYTDKTGNSNFDLKVNTNNEGSYSLIFNKGTSKEEVIEFPASGDIDQATAQKLKEYGIDLHEVKNLHETGTTLNFTRKVELQTDEEQADDSETDAAAKTISELPEGFELSQNYPNPFNPTTTINFSIPASDHVTLEIINMSGQIVKTLVDQTMSAGNHSIEWDATNRSGSKVASGVYLYRLATSTNSTVKKMTLLK